MRIHLSLALKGAVPSMVVGATILAFVACSSSDDNPKAGSGFDGSADAPTNTSSSGNASGFTPNDSAPPPADTGPQPACVSQEADAVPGTRPVDIIFAIDNSSSMSEEISEVENQINVNFASIIESSNTDYRVIMVSKHGNHAPGLTLQKICVKSPLSGTTCDPIPAKPVETDKFIHHNTVIDSNNALCQLLTSYAAADDDGNHQGGWSKFLRPKAFKVFTVITDDHPAVSCQGRTYDDKINDKVSATTMAQTWDSFLVALAPDQFGTAARRQYIFNSIVGVKGYDALDTSKLYPPTAPISTEVCTPSSEAPGVGYQALSVLTGGLRYPTCGLNYTTMFQSMARAVISKAFVTCDYGIPANPPGGKIDPSTVAVRYTSTTKPQEDFAQVASLASCVPDKFYIDGDRIKLCPDTCAKVQADESAKVTVRYSCFPKDVQ